MFISRKQQRRSLRFAGHFHVHDEYSPLDGGGNRNQLTWAASHAGQTHLGFTNHGRLGGALEHVHACRYPEEYDDPFEPDRKRSAEERLSPILGMEAFFRPDRFMDLSDEKRYGKNGHNWAHHLCLHAGSLNGWRTLLRLSSKSWVRREYGGGYYGKPCIDPAMIAEDHEDIIISTACLASPLAYFILEGDEAGAKRWLRKMRRYSKNGRIWLEIMPHDLDAQRELNLGIVNIAYETGDPVVATGDVHVPFEGWKVAHQVIRLASYQQSFSNRESKKDAGEEVYTDEIGTVYLSSAAEMFAQFQEFHPDLPEDIVLEAMANTAELARDVRWYVIGKTTKAPKVDVDAKQEVTNWVDEGWKRILGSYERTHWTKWLKEDYVKRYRMEMEVLEQKGVLAYFYIVGDFVRWAKSTNGLPKVDRNGKVKRDKRGNVIYDGTKRPIRVGLGRGSAAGSLVSYLIGITQIDPISHKLLFERFLNPDRVGYPDIDMDFETELPVIEIQTGEDKDGNPTYKWLDGRECVKEYLKRMYGHDHVVDIIAYQTFAPRAVIKEVGKVYDLDYGYLNTITDSIGDTDRGLERIANGRPDKGIEPNELVAGLREKHPDIWDVLLKLEDQILRDTRHAGGVVITPKPTNWYVPTQIAADEETTVTAWADRADFPVLSDYGFLKYDILGVKSLAKQELACQLILEHYGIKFEPNDLPALRNPLDVEQAVIDIFVNGLTWEVFQFGSRGITQLLRHIRPNNATDISVANALYRPGPIAIAFEYGDRKNGTTPITYWHESLEPILGETLGLMCFQEQAMEVAKQIGNFTGGQADALRKAMSKLYRLPGDKAQEFMQNFYEQWMKGCHENGLRERDAHSIWADRMLPLGNYLFNRSHSSSYGLQAYQDAHIKLHYPLAFYAAALTNGGKNEKDKQRDWLKSGLREARVFDIDAIPPSVNRSERGWSIDRNKLRYGLVSISGMGGGLAHDVIDHRPFRDFPEFIHRMPSGFGVDKMVALAKAGAFDELADRKYLLSRVKQWDDGVIKLKMKMSCGHIKSKTIKKVEPGHEEQAIEEALALIECKHHPDATIEDVKRLDDSYEVVRFLKQNPDEEPQIIGEPTDREIDDMELEALNISLRQAQKLLYYKPYIDARVFGEDEVAKLPEKPKRKGDRHGSFCKCDACDAAAVVVGGEIVNIKVILTKKKKEPMAFIDVSYGTNQYSCTLFPYIYKQYSRLITRPTAFLIAGHRDDRGQIIVNEIADVVDLAEEEGWEPEKVVSIKRAKKKATKKSKPKIRRKVAA